MLGGALSEWAGSGARRAYAREIAQIHAGYRAALERRGLVDRELFAWRTLDAFREKPDAWGATPVFVYGFDDFTDVELAGIEALAEHVDVTLSFPYERGRHAFDALAETFTRLEAKADEHIELEGVPDHYEPAARAALHHLERGLFDARGEPMPGGRGRAPAFGGRRARGGGAGRGVGARAARRRHRRGRHGGRLSQPRELRVAGRPGLLRIRNPVLPRPHGAARPHAARPRAARAAAVRPAGACGHYRGSPHLPALARPPGRAGQGGPARGHGAPGRRPRRRARRASSGRTRTRSCRSRRSTPCATRAATR